MLVRCPFTCLGWKVLLVLNINNNWVNTGFSTSLYAWFLSYKKSPVRDLAKLVS